MKSVFQRFFKTRTSSSGEKKEGGLPQEMIRGGKVAALQGDIAAIKLDDVVQLVDYAGLTGELEILSSQNTGYFYFQKGLLIFGLLLSRQQKIGELLLAEQLITSEQLAECLELHQNEERKQRLGNIFIEKGYVKQDNLTSSLSKQIKESFFEALTWKEGSFQFYVNQAPGEDELLLNERVDSLLLEGMVHIDNEEFLK